MLILWLSLPAQAHDYLLAAEPSGPRRVVYGVVAHARAREERRERPETLARLDRIVGDEVEPLASHEGGWASVEVAAHHVTTVVYENTGAMVELEWERFRNYVADEGDPRVLDVVDGLPREPQREHYRRSTKLLLGVEEGRPGWDRVVGQPLELVLLERPGTSKIPRLRLLASGEPVKGAKVRAYPYLRHSEKHAVSALTDERGIATLPLGRPGQDWVFAAVVMTYDPDRDVPWHSIWTSLRVE